MNDYERKQAERKARLERAARRKAAQASAAHAGARRIMDGIPLGQPILVGHHSERRHRRDIAKIDRGMRKAAELSDEAEGLAYAAKVVGTGGISSDDPDALAKLRAKLADLNAARATEKLWNAALRRQAKARAAELGRDLKPSDHVELIAHTTMPESFKTALISQARAFPWLPQFGDHTATAIRATEQRIAELERKAAAPERPALAGDGWTLRENKEANRTQIAFAGVPDKALRARLKARGFKWSPSAGVWQRHLSNGAWYDATQILGPGSPIVECGCSPSVHPCREHETDPTKYPCPDGPNCTEGCEPFKEIDL